MLKGIVVAVAALTLTGMAFASQADTYKLRAAIRPGSEVPKPKGVPATATGLFTGKSVELANDKASLTWKLTFSHLSGRAIAAHIHIGRRGKAGTVLVALCGPCKSGQTGQSPDHACSGGEDREGPDVREHPHLEERRGRDPRPDHGHGDEVRLRREPTTASEPEPRAAAVPVDRSAGTDPLDHAQSWGEKSWCPRPTWHRCDQLAPVRR